MHATSQNTMSYIKNHRLYLTQQKREQLTKPRFSKLRLSLGRACNAFTCLVLRKPKHDFKGDVGNNSLSLHKEFEPSLGRLCIVFVCLCYVSVELRL